MTGPGPLTIGIDARAAAEVPAGRGRVVRELLRALAARATQAAPHAQDARGHGWDDHRYVLYARERWDEPLGERFHWHLLHMRDPWWHAATARAANRECQAFFSSNSYVTPLFLRIPTVTLVHDLITFEPSMRPNRRSTVIERLTLGPAVRRSAALLTTSRATTDALGRHFPAATARTVIAPLGVMSQSSAGLDETEAAGLPPAGFVLAVGTLEPRKNLPRLVEAYSALEESLQRDHPLVVVGALGWEAGETLTALHKLGERCTMLGYVSDAALAELYRRCAAFCYPSLGEGFGLPVLEAMAAGAAVVTSNVSSLPEVGGDAVEYVDPHDTGSIARGMERVLRDAPHRAELQRRAHARAASFSWYRFAEIALDAVQQASRSARRPSGSHTSLE